MCKKGCWINKTYNANTTRTSKYKLNVVYTMLPYAHYIIMYASYYHIRTVLSLLQLKAPIA
jgi:hypothetical protein